MSNVAIYFESVLQGYKTSCDNLSLFNSYYISLIFNNFFIVL